MTTNKEGLLPNSRPLEGMQKVSGESLNTGTVTNEQIADEEVSLPVIVPIEELLQDTESDLFCDEKTNIRSSQGKHRSTPLPSDPEGSSTMSWVLGLRADPTKPKGGVRVSDSGKAGDKSPWTSSPLPIIQRFDGARKSLSNRGSKDGNFQSDIEADKIWMIGGAEPDFASSMYKKMAVDIVCDPKEKEKVEEFATLYPGGATLWAQDAFVTFFKKASDKSFHQEPVPDSKSNPDKSFAAIWFGCIFNSSKNTVTRAYLADPDYAERQEVHNSDSIYSDNFKQRSSKRTCHFVICLLSLALMALIIFAVSEQPLLPAGEPTTTHRDSPPEITEKSDDQLTPGYPQTILADDESEDECAHIKCTETPPLCHAHGVCGVQSGGPCTFPPLPDGTECDDGDAQTLNDRCQGGVCRGTVPPPPTPDLHVCTGDAPVVDGYDVVAYFSLASPSSAGIRGSREECYRERGYDFWFSSRGNLEIFKNSTESFIPQFGGFCAWGLATQWMECPAEYSICSPGYPWSKEHLLATGGPPAGPKDAWLVQNGKLYFNILPSYRKLWEGNVKAFIERAEKRWIDWFGSLEEGPLNNKCYDWNYQQICL